MRFSVWVWDGVFLFCFFKTSICSLMLQYICTEVRYLYTHTYININVSSDTPIASFE